MAHARPFGLLRPKETYPCFGLQVIDLEAWSKYKSKHRGVLGARRLPADREDRPKDILIRVTRASVGYFPGPGKPSHMVIWHDSGVLVVPYELVEWAGEIKNP